MKQKWIGCIALLMCLVGCGTAEPMVEAPELLEPVGVKISAVPVERGDLIDADVYQGAVVPHVEELQFLVDGTLETVHVRLGEKVKEGQLLMTLSEEHIHEQIEQLEQKSYRTSTLGEYADRQKQAKIDIAKAELERLRKSFGTKEEIQKKELEVRQLELDLQQAQELRQLELSANHAAMEAQRSKLGNSELIAPFEGRVVYVSAARSGTNILGYTTVICLADDTQPLISAEYIPEGEMKSAERIYARILDQEYLLTYQPYDMSEYITKSLSGETIESRFVVDTPTEQIECGQYAAIVVVHREKKDVLCVPANAVYQESGGKYVYLIEDGQRVVRNVTTGMSTEAKVEIVEGLEEGDLVYVKE